MRHAITLVGTAVLSSALTSAFWLVAFNKDAPVEASTGSVPIARVSSTVVAPAVRARVG